MILCGVGLWLLENWCLLIFDDVTSIVIICGHDGLASQLLFGTLDDGCGGVLNGQLFTRGHILNIMWRKILTLKILLVLLFVTYSTDATVHFIFHRGLGPGRHLLHEQLILLKLLQLLVCSSTLARCPGTCSSTTRRWFLQLWGTRGFLRLLRFALAQFTLCWGALDMLGSWGSIECLLIDNISSGDSVKSFNGVHVLSKLVLSQIVLSKWYFLKLFLSWRDIWKIRTRVFSLNNAFRRGCHQASFIQSLLFGPFSHTN